MGTALKTALGPQSRRLYLREPDILRLGAGVSNESASERTAQLLQERVYDSPEFWFVCQIFAYEAAAVGCLPLCSPPFEPGSIPAAAVIAAALTASYRWFETPSLRGKSRFEHIPSREAA